MFQVPGLSLATISGIRYGGVQRVFKWGELRVERFSPCEFCREPTNKRTDLFGLLVRGFSRDPQ